MSRRTSGRALGMRQINQRLVDGADPQALLDDLIGCVMLDKSPDLPNVMRRVMRLVESGARVASEDKSCPLQRVLDQPLIQQHPGLIMVLVEAVENIPGEIPFHLLVRRDLGFFHTVETNCSINQTTPLALRARDTCGRTVSHWLWAEDGLLARRARTASRARPDTVEKESLNNAWRASNNAAWHIQRLLESAGAGLDVPDHDCVTAMHLCVQRIRTGEALVLPNNPLRNRVQAFLDARQLQGNTPGVSLPSPIPASAPRI